MDIFNTIANAIKPENSDYLKYQEFKKIEKDLKNKHKKICKKIKIHVLWINENLHKPFKSLSENQKISIRKYIESLNLDNLHDSQYNIEGLISENYLNFVHWSTYLEPRKSTKVWLDKNRLECFKMYF